ncbi:MAG: selenide, water dikinase SelD [Bacteroidetes bacterium]|nr:MAG: selenide, water dikinase SelD [Bacteroidota bacterium]
MNKQTVTPIYLDYNATTPIDPEVAEAMRPFLQSYFGNPSSSHAYGITTRKAIEKAREQVAKLINASPSEIIFTSGGTESNNYALKGVALANRHKGNHLITSSIEHPAIFEVCKYLERNGFRVTYLPVDTHGIISIKELKRAIEKETILITIMHANNETGSIQPIEEIGKIAKERGILFHTDAAQSLGKIEADVESLKVDLLSIAGHKLYAPKGIGALYIRNGVTLEKLIHGANHEQNLRAGTENVLEIVGLGKAAEIAHRDLAQNAAHYMQQRDALHQAIMAAIPEVKLNGHPTLRLPNTLSLSFPGVEANTLISRLETVAASAGAACHTESIDVSAVLEAMKIPIRYAMGTIRFSTGRSNTPEEIRQAAKTIVETAQTLMPKEEMLPLKPVTTHEEIKLTHYTHGLGCACKIAPQALEEILKTLPPWNHPNILVGTETADDATIYQINEDTAIVQTLDFFTPIADNPYDFGAIAAANALSDIYAMGATPLFALNIVAFPENTLPMEVLQDILRGAHDKAHEAGIGVLGGHTIEDPEPKYGMVVTGIIHPQKILKNHGARPGDQLILTKPLGTGIIATGIKRGLTTKETEERALSLMKQLNKVAAEAMGGYPVHACTDVTGFGLMGHLLEMSRASKTDVQIWYDALPLLDEAIALATADVIPGGTHKNHAFVKEQIDFGGYGRVTQMLLCDAQTSGGLLIALEREKARQLLSDLHHYGVEDAVIIGEFTHKGTGAIHIV